MEKANVTESAKYLSNVANSLIVVNTWTLLRQNCGYRHAFSIQSKAISLGPLSSDEAQLGINLASIIMSSGGSTVNLKMLEVRRVLSTAPSLLLPTRL